MDQKDKLEALIQKAIKGGWRNQYVAKDEGGNYFYGGVTSSTLPMHTYPIVFNHDFAKALWPGVYSRGITLEPHLSYTGKWAITPKKAQNYPVTEHDWQHHLKQAVIDDDPIGYMYSTVFNKQAKEDK